MGEMTSDATERRTREAYMAYRAGFADDKAPPHWTELQAWVRDTARIAYIQGKLDGMSVKAGE